MIGALITANTQANQPQQHGGRKLIWQGKKRLWFGAPWTFTTYYIYDSELVVKTGFLSQKFDSTKLFRIVDITMTRSLIQRIFGLTTLTVNSMDRSTEGVVLLKNIRNGEEVEQILQSAIDEERQRNRVGTREFYGDMDGDGIDDGMIGM